MNSGIEHSETGNPPLPRSSGSANWESRLGFLFGILLLIVAGGTATSVGFKVKQAQIVRKAELKSSFHSLAGAPSAIENASRVIQLSGPESTERRNFVSTYQLNEWVRTAGLTRTLQELEPRVIADALQGLSVIGATEAYHATAETWALMHDVEEEVAKSAPPSLLPPTQPNSSKARRIGRRYDRTFIRDVEAKLYHYLHQHSAEITGR